MASPIPQRTRGPGTAGRRRRGGGGGGGGRRRRGRRREGAAHCGHATGGHAESVTASVAVDPREHPAPSGARRRAVPWGDRRRGAGPRMSRRQTDLEPGVEPDAGETGALPRAERPPAHSPAVVAARHASARRAAERRPARRPSAGPSGDPRRRRGRQLAVAALGAVDRARADRRRVPREQPRRRQLVEGRPHVLAVRERGRRRQRQEHRVQQVDRRDQRQVRRAGQRQDGVLELRPEGQPARRRCSTTHQEEGRRLQVRRRRAATSSATSCCGCCRSC